MNGKEIIKKLKKEGWEVARIRGSHHIMKKEGFLPVPVAVHGSRDIPKGTLKSIEKATGVTLT